jgi:hypothetical protein
MRPLIPMCPARPVCTMAWHGTLDLRYRVDHGGGSPRCIVADRHDGPLRVLAPHPEGYAASVGPCTCRAAWPVATRWL